MADQYAAADLNIRFLDLWKRCLPPKAEMGITPIYEKLVKCYSEPQRRYHSSKHVAHCLRELDRASALTSNRDAVEMALWFHDIVYIPGAADNEQRSAELFVRWSEHHLLPSFIERVRSLIMLTAHKKPPENEEESYILDIDLSSFGVPWVDFLQDSQNVREEQIHVRDEDYYSASTRFLQSLIDRPRIFHTEHFHALYEDTARQNIRQLINLIAYKGSL